ESLFDRAWYDRTKISDELINHYLEPLKVENWDRALYAYTKASVNPKITKRLKEIDIPVLIIHGEEDAVVPLKESIKLNKEISSSVLEVINSCGHAPQEECSQEVIEIILRFLSSIGYE
ncbi:MAG: alpha/beta hydrolase, partial [Spirochaetia bacterium]|nr:alpha/beta hydrolase [Spirochaetia bacterium]